MKRNGLIYTPEKSIEQNAKSNKVSVTTVRKYIQKNGIDRQGDNKILKSRRILEYRKLHPDMPLTRVAKELHISYNTLKKYLKDPFNISNINTHKVSSFDTTKRKFVISSVSESQHVILNNILRLYVPKGYFDADLTYNLGKFYKKIPQPQIKFDKFPLTEDTMPLDLFPNMVPDNSLDSIVYDLPFIIKSPGAVTPKIMDELFDSFSNIKELYEVNEEMLRVSHCKLKKKGILVVKTQDLNMNKQYWIANFIQNKAKELRFELIDLFILVAKTRPLACRNLSQRSARKFHSYFLVFRKK